MKLVSLRLSNTLELGSRVITGWEENDPNLDCHFEDTGYYILHEKHGDRVWYVPMSAGVGEFRKTAKDKQEPKAEDSKPQKKGQ